MTQTHMESAGRDIVLRARLFRSPFAIAAAAVIAGQAMLVIMAFAVGRGDLVASGAPIFAASLAMFAVGAAPCWNFLRITPAGFEQHAGLSILRNDWGRVQSVLPRTSGAEVRHIIGQEDARRVRAEFLLNRYGVTADEFATMVEGRWRRARTGRSGRVADEWSFDS